MLNHHCRAQFAFKVDSGSALNSNLPWKVFNVRLAGRLFEDSSYPSSMPANPLGTGADATAMSITTGKTFVGTLVIQGTCALSVCAVSLSTSPCSDSFTSTFSLTATDCMTFPDFSEVLLPGVHMQKSPLSCGERRPFGGLNSEDNFSKSF